MFFNGATVLAVLAATVFQAGEVLGHARVTSPTPRAVSLPDLYYPLLTIHLFSFGYLVWKCRSRRVRERRTHHSEIRSVACVLDIISS